jgi:type 1 glutamine amidotransferase
MAPARLAITPRNKEVHYYPADEPPTRLGCGRPCVRPDADYALSWIHNYGKGCVFFKALGHTPAFFATPNLSDFFFRGIQFVLGDLQAETTPSSKRSR